MRHIVDVFKPPDKGPGDEKKIGEETEEAGGGQEIEVFVVGLVV